jgi:4a-hydroxytetrahydrobiopterin dehydratase
MTGSQTPRLLSDDEIADRLGALPGWRRHGSAIAKEFTCAGFPEAVAFVSRLVAPSEAADHHPDLEIHYRRVVVSFTTHSAGGLTVKDFDGARSAEDLAR